MRYSGLTGWLGFTTGPIINMYAQIPGGMGNRDHGTGRYRRSSSSPCPPSPWFTKKDFSFLTNFIMVGILVAFVASLANIFFQIPALSLAVSAAFMMLSSLLIMWADQRHHSRR